MSDPSAGGVGGWTGTAFELRLGVEFCVYMLVGDVAGRAFFQNVQQALAQTGTG